MNLKVAWLAFYASKVMTWTAADALLNAWPELYDAWGAEA
jgi:hypothetical protein